MCPSLSRHCPDCSMNRFVLFFMLFTYTKRRSFTVCYSLEVGNGYFQFCIKVQINVSRYISTSTILIANLLLERSTREEFRITLLWDIILWDFKILQSQPSSPKGLVIDFQKQFNSCQNFSRQYAAVVALKNAFTSYCSLRLTGQNILHDVFIYYRKLKIFNTRNCGYHY